MAHSFSGYSSSPWGSCWGQSVYSGVNGKWQYFSSRHLRNPGVTPELDFGEVFKAIPFADSICQLEPTLGRFHNLQKQSCQTRTKPLKHKPVAATPFSANPCPTVFSIFQRISVTSGRDYRDMGLQNHSLSKGPVCIHGHSRKVQMRSILLPGE